MIEYYAGIKAVHVAAVIASGALFFLRGLLVRAGRGPWALAPLPRYLSYAIDTTLLTAALMLVSILPSAVYANGWLAAKLALLPVYIALGWLALRRPGAGGRQAAYFAGAVVVYLCMFAIARTHDPAGPLRLLAGASGPL
jgi:uncharacterized membrane protein SirB2